MMIGKPVPNFALAVPERLKAESLNAIIKNAFTNGFGSDWPKDILKGTVAEKRRVLINAKSSYWNSVHVPKERDSVPQMLTATECNEFLATLPTYPIAGEE